MCLSYNVLNVMYIFLGLKLEISKYKFMSLKIHVQHEKLKRKVDEIFLIK